MEIITGIERRGRWRLEDKLRIIAETAQPGASVAEIARRHEISRSLIWNWCSQARRGRLTRAAVSALLPVQVVSEPAPLAVQGASGRDFETGQQQPAASAGGWRDLDGLESALGR